jgi:MoxR-like ATPase
LPEAQLDRFLLYVRVQYPDVEGERKIAELVRSQARATPGDSPTTLTPVPQKVIVAARRQMWDVYLAPTLEEYIVQLVMATREPAPYSAMLKRWIRFGASPRATIGLERGARAHAWLEGRDYVSPEDIQAVVHDVLRHRVLLTFEAEAEGIRTDQVISEIVNYVAVP